MAHCYKFAIIRLSPDEQRGEALNVGLVVFKDDSLDVRVTKRIEKIRALSSSLDVEDLRELVEGLHSIDEKLRYSGADTLEVRLEMLSRLGPISLSGVGTFSSNSINDYEERISSIFRAMIEPEPLVGRARTKRSGLLTQMKSQFRQERVLAKKDENINSHRIISAFALDEGLTADLVLKNGKMHVVEPVDVSNEEDTLRKAISDIAVSALILERARMKFGEKKTKSRLVYNASSALERVALPSLEAAAHQGAELINWASDDERRKFVQTLTSLATPTPRRNVRRPMRIIGG